MPDQNVRILLVDDDPDYPILIKDLLSDIDETLYSIDWAPTFRKASEKIRSSTYDIYLVDYRLGEHTGLDLLRGDLDYGRRGPVVILTGQETRELDLEAMQAGALDFLIKGQFKATDLHRCIRYALSRYRQNTTPAQARTFPVPHRMLSLIGAKGGVGTTSVAFHLASALVRKGQPTLALDLRPYFGPLGNFVTPVVRQDLGDVLRQTPKDINEGLLRRCFASNLAGLEVLASPQNAHKYRPIPAEAARAILETANQISDYTVVDLPCDASPANREAMWRSTFVGLVVEREPTALACAERMLQLMGGWGVRKAVGLIVVDRAPHYGAGISDVAARLERQVYGIIPAHPPGSSRSPASSVGGEEPGTGAAAHSQAEVARAYAELAERLAADVLRPLPV